MKRILAKAILRWQLPRFLHDSHPFNRLMGQAIELQSGHMTDEAFRVQLDGFYRQIDPAAIKLDIDLSSKVARLDRPGGYKTDISAIGPQAPGAAKGSRFDLWRRRFGLLRHIGIRSDVIILRRDERIPPHGHHRVVSGFYVLEGQVAIRHYDRVGQMDNALLVRKVLDTTLEPAGFTTNSETFHNIHWLQGLAEKSFLFRVTVVDTPSPLRHGRVTDSRLYIDPTGAPDSTGLITAPFISESQAKQLVIRPQVRPDYAGISAI
jgi:hypothetical protein